MAPIDQLEIILDHVKQPASDLDVYDELDWRFMFAVILSSQTTDVQVNKITPALFKKFSTLEAFAQASQSEVEEMLNTIPFFRVKARALIMNANRLIDTYNNKIPGTMESLLTFKGVGRKVANVILSSMHNVPAVVVDTHVIRVTNRLGWVTTENPEKIEQVLGTWIPNDKKVEASTKLVLFGRYVCRAKKPNCSDCPLNAVCPSRRI